MKKTPPRSLAARPPGRKTRTGAAAKKPARTAKPLAEPPGKPAPRSRVASGRAPVGAEAKIRRLKAQLAAALAQIDELRASADTDYLLGIANRRGFERELDRALAYIKRYDASGALIMLDVDGLKPVNDRFGHAAGDVVLKAVVEALLGHVRASDLIGRLGGDEFALLLWNLSEADARKKAAALEEAVDRLPIQFGAHTVSAGISAGVAMLTGDMDAAEALASADRAMYVRKAQRRAASGRSVRR
ncbi:GGDEF domain-containing protein [Rhodopseudomonas sp. HC1]|uniref:GGDEF domain-containing protein n=1 Tax=Rhodopseudomonas infernalis TaxID=2897386 RepID=UPI001EE8650C|nr:GGDEF domain-containing protein [Rhodopseudomonas infernalis]MCG6204957.1 GGDEF domain-containing protein [Rhodopseudomonas infernalis]